MYCQKCGAENPDEAKFCKSCGVAIISEFHIENNENKKITHFYIIRYLLGIVMLVGPLVYCFAFPLWDDYYNRVGFFICVVLLSLLYAGLFIFFRRVVKIVDYYISGAIIFLYLGLPWLLLFNGFWPGYGLESPPLGIYASIPLIFCTLIFNVLHRRIKY